MRLSDYIRLDKNFKYKLINTDLRSLGIGCVGMAIFCCFLINWSWRTIDHAGVFYFYLICFAIAELLYIYPLVLVYEDGYIPIFQKYKNIPINKRLFFYSKLLLLVRFSLLFCIPVQLFHLWGISRTSTPYLSMIGFWPVLSMLITLLVLYICLRILAHNFTD